MKNKAQILVKRPVGFPTKETWSLEESLIPELNSGEILIENHYISLDPAMRGWVQDEPSYLPPVAIGDPQNILLFSRPPKHPKRDLEKD